MKKTIKILFLFSLFSTLFSFPPLPIEVEGKIVCEKDLTNYPLTVKVEGSFLNKTFLINQNNEFYIYINPENESLIGKPLEFYLINQKLNYTPIIYFQPEKEIKNINLKIQPNCSYYLDKLIPRENITKKNESINNNQTTNTSTQINDQENKTKEHVENDVSNEQNNSDKDLNNDKKTEKHKNKKEDNFNYTIEKKLIHTSFSTKIKKDEKLINQIKQYISEFYLNDLGIKLDENILHLKPVNLTTEIYKIKLKNNKTAYLVKRYSNTSVIELFKKEFIKNSSFILVVNGSSKVIKEDPIILFKPEKNSYSYIIEKDFKDDFVNIFKRDVETFSLSLNETINETTTINKTENSTTTTKTKNTTVSETNEKLINKHNKYKQIEKDKLLLFLSLLFLVLSILLLAMIKKKKKKYK